VSIVGRLWREPDFAIVLDLRKGELSLKEKRQVRVMRSLG
jgi:hypothetical protein